MRPVAVVTGRAFRGVVCLTAMLSARRTGMFMRVTSALVRGTIVETCAWVGQPSSGSPNGPTENVTKPGRSSVTVRDMTVISGAKTRDSRPGSVSGPLPTFVAQVPRPTVSAGELRARSPIETRPAIRIQAFQTRFACTRTRVRSSKSWPIKDAP